LQPGRGGWPISASGGGNHYYGQTADDLMEPFQEELALINAVCGRQVRLQLEAPAGVRVEVLNDYRHGEDGWALPDLLAGGEAWALVRLTIPAHLVPEAAGGSVALLDARVRYLDLAGEPRAVQAPALGLGSLAASAHGALAEAELVVTRLTELEGARLQREARDAVRRGDWPEADRLLGKIEALARDHEWLRAILEELRLLASRRDAAMFGKEALYSAQRLSTRVAACVEPRELDDDLQTCAMPAFLRRKAAQGKRGTAGPGKG